MIDLRAYREGIVADLERCRSDLRPLESGKVTLRSKTAGEEWRDITKDAIERQRQTIAT